MKSAFALFNPIEPYQTQKISLKRVDFFVKHGSFHITKTKTS